MSKSKHRQLPRIIPMPELTKYSKPQETRALELVAFLESRDGATSADCCGALGITKSVFDATLSCARELICRELDVTIPHPVPDDGWKYRVTGDWVNSNHPAIAAGTGYAVGQIESRLKSVLRDAAVAKKHLDPHSLDGRKVNALTMHLSHVLSVLSEISGEEQARDAR